MSLKTQVESGIKDAMRAKNQDSLRALRAIKSMILLEETKGGGTGELTSDDELKLLMAVVAKKILLASRFYAVFLYFCAVAVRTEHLYEDAAHSRKLLTFCDFSYNIHSESRPFFIMSNLWTSASL